MRLLVEPLLAVWRCLYVYSNWKCSKCQNARHRCSHKMCKIQKKCYELLATSAFQQLNQMSNFRFSGFNDFQLITVFLKNVFGRCGYFLCTLYNTFVYRSKMQECWLAYSGQFFFLQLIHELLLVKWNAPRIAYTTERTKCDGFYQRTKKGVN